MRLKLILIPAIVILISNAGAQEKKSLNIWDPPVQKGISSLNVGDSVPDFKIEKIFNGNQQQASISDFRNRLLIFDFGNTGCKGCVEALPRMDSLEQKFSDRLRIFWVTPESESTVQNFWKKNWYTKGNRLQSIVEDSVVRAYFKHKSWPHEVWIYKGRVIAITGPEYVDAKNIQKVLNEEKINWPVKNDFYSFNAKKEPLFHLNQEKVDVNDRSLRYAAISDYKEGVDDAERLTTIIRDTLKKTVRAYIVNQSIYNCYLMNGAMTSAIVLNRPSFSITPNQIVWEVPDKSRYHYTSEYGYQQDWIRKNGICFESQYADNGQNNKEISKTIISDLNYLLGLSVGWEKRKEKVFVLVRIGEKLRNKILPKKGDEVLTTNGHIQQFRGATLSDLCFVLNKQAKNPYVFDETGYTGTIDMDLNIPSWTNIAAIQKALTKYGLNLKEEERIVDKLLFRLNQ